MKIVTIIGARPQFVKAAAVSRQIQGIENIQEIVIHTGQHFDSNMSDVFFEEMDIPKPNHFLGVSGVSHGAMTGRMLEKIEQALIAEKPDKVMVYGDTNSTLAGALAASKLHIPVIHVEAGLRSFNMKMPEEINRILTDRISQYLLCPTSTAIKNLEAEGYGAMSVVLENTGDVMQDVALYYSEFAKPPAGLTHCVADSNFILSTLHRAENTDDPGRLEQIIEALNETHSKVPVILPMHPRTSKILQENSIETTFHTLEPASYFEMLWLLKNCQMVVTDSGGLQKEAFFFNKPCVTLRDETEWVELINMGVNKLAGADKANILQTIETMTHVKVTDSEGVYGGGIAASRIASVISK